MLVALGVFALIASAGAALTLAVLGTRDDLAARQERLRDLQLARAILRADLLHMLPRPSLDDLGMGRPLALRTGAEAGRNALASFIRGGWMNPGGLEPRGPLLRVTYVLDGDRLVRRTALRPDRTADTPVEETVLLSGVRAAALRFRVQGRWTDWWTGGPTALPDLVALELELEGLGSLHQLFPTGGGV